MRYLACMLVALLAAKVDGQIRSGESVAVTRQPDNPTTLRQWQTITLSFQGPQTSESATPNPFTDYRLLVTFTHRDAQYVIRGFFAADGNAADTSADQGNVWQARFSPDRPGHWTYSAALRRGDDIAISDDGEAGTTVDLSDASGSFDVESSLAKSDSIDFRNRGRLIADAGYLRFGKSGRRWLKGGADSPENLLAFAGFDGTRRISTETTEGEATASETLHRYEAHIPDWHEDDPTWKADKGKGLIGAINYLSSTGMNAVYFLTLNIGGDGKDVWPYATPEEFTRFDCSKLDQWEIVFEQMQRRGILMHVVTQETENERMLDDGNTGRLRKLYYRELIARFAHHPALIWNLGEENGPAEFSPNGQTSQQQKAMATYLKQSDPYNHPVVIHTHAGARGKDEILTHLLGHAPLDGVSFQVANQEDVHGEVVRWREKAQQAGRPWLISMDEIGMWHTGVVPDDVDPDHDALRRFVLWGSLMAGAAGVEWYFGAKYPHNDLTSEDWRKRASMWKQTRHALEFFETRLPYWEMRPAGNLTTTPNTYCFAKPGNVYVLYVAKGTFDDHQNLSLKLGSSASEFSVSWYDPLAAGELHAGTISRVSGPGEVDLGSPKGSHQRDWVVLVKEK